VDNHDLWDTKILEAPSRISSLTHPGDTVAPVLSALRRPKSLNQQ
jgi:hypothetical protein